MSIVSLTLLFANLVASETCQDYFDIYTTQTTCQGPYSQSTLSRIMGEWLEWTKCIEGQGVRKHLRIKDRICYNPWFGGSPNCTVQRQLCSDLRLPYDSSTADNTARTRESKGMSAGESPSTEPRKDNLNPTTTHPVLSGDKPQSGNQGSSKTGTPWTTYSLIGLSVICLCSVAVNIAVLVLKNKNQERQLSVRPRAQSERTTVSSCTALANLETRFPTDDISQTRLKELNLSSLYN